MKQIDIIKTYSQKRCLVVDDVPDIRASLKRILVDFGSTNIDTAGNADEAIDLCQRFQYDIVLADYNLGSSKNGQQLLEELRFHGLLRNTSLYIMITAETAVQSVLHALEYQPDDYLNKPISRDTLRPRLDQALLKNEALLVAKKALDQKKPRKAIAACEKLIAKNDRYTNEARKMLGELHIQQQNYEEALGVYSQITADRTPIWATLGIAQAKFGLEQFEATEALLNKLIDENPLCIEAQDLLARVFEAQQNYGRAQQTLINAIKISPRSADRQREMGRVSQETGDEQLAAHAYRAALKYSKNTCHERPEDYLSLSQSLTNLLRENSANTGTAAVEILETLKQAEKRFGKQPLVQIRGKLVEADLYQIQKKDDQSRAVLNDALDAHGAMSLSAVQNTSIELCIDCAKAFMALGEYEAGEQLLHEVARLNSDPKIAISIDKLLREPLSQEGIQFAAKLNRQGIQFYQQKKYNEAIDSFRHVLKELPNHIGLNLNLIQAIISKNKNGDISDAECEIVASSLQRIGKIEHGSNYAERYQYIVRQYEKLITGQD